MNTLEKLLFEETLRRNAAYYLNKCYRNTVQHLAWSFLTSAVLSTEESSDSRPLVELLGGEPEPLTKHVAPSVVSRKEQMAREAEIYFSPSLISRRCWPRSISYWARLICRLVFSLVGRCSIATEFVLLLCPKTTHEKRTLRCQDPTLLTLHD